LYGLPLEKIEVVVHPQSIIHSMVEFIDHSVKAQLGIPDMRIPIQYALTYPERLTLDVPRADFREISRLDFEPPDMEKFPCLRLAFEAISAGKTFPAVLNAANEVAVEAFLNDKIRFTVIPEIIEEILDAHSPLVPDSLEDYLAVDTSARSQAMDLINLKQLKR
jgi:1-deoxy-D-xylulose-5-phosphate reductoisomerase